ncbi:hypothetical protein NIES4102_27030 [Chondrocystis sp. NIES-4102]|nr:hypothetical protein NIES4102_27030 [Chondrocystis sp. NIES-4102]
MSNLNNSLEKDITLRAANLKNMMLDLGLANPHLIKGCSKQEIINLESEYNVTLPNSYKVFLENFGHGLEGRVMNDIDILYDQVLPLTSIARNQILIDEGDPVLPEKAFVFCMRYGEQFMFFDASGLVEEPPIFYYMENDTAFKKVGDSIFDILEGEINFSEKIKLRREEIKKGIIEKS